MSRFDPAEYWENRLSENYNLRGVGHVDLGPSYNRWLYKIKERAFFNVLASMKLDASKSDVFDIGSGTGFYIDMWKRAGAKSITGSDITQVAVSRLSQKYSDCKFHTLDISNSDALHVQFDIISAFDILYHIVDDEKFTAAIKNIYKLLRPGGLFIFSENFLHTDTIRIKHVVSRSLSEITAILQKQGFEILDRRAQFVYMNNPIDASAMRQRLWSLFTLPAIKSDAYGNLIGALIYPFETRAINRKESPTTEIMVCRKS